VRRWLAILLGFEVKLAKMRHELAKREVEAAKSRVKLLGPIHGTVQTIRGMCSDELTHEEIDGKLGELDELIYEAAGLLGAGR
jgi:hypothetical protein